MLSFKEWKELNATSVDLNTISKETNSAIEDILEAKKKMKKKMDPEAVDSEDEEMPEEDDESEDEEMPEDEKEIQDKDKEDDEEEDEGDAETGDGEVVEPSSEKDAAMFMKKKMKKKMCDKKSKKENTEIANKAWLESFSKIYTPPKKKIEENVVMPKLCPKTGIVLKD